LCILGHSAKWRGWSLLDGIGDKFDAPRNCLAVIEKHATAFCAARAGCASHRSRVLF